MVVSDAIHNIMGGMESTAGVRLHNHRRKLKQRFDIIKKLGQGTYGKVQLGINKETGQEVAIKTIKKSKIETDADLVRIRREIQIMSSVQHPNIIHIYEVFENREKMVLVMEYAAGGELYDYLSERKVLDETEARRIFRQISTAVYYCHKHKICHRDLKLENILLDEHGSAKIADFGLSNVFDEQRLLGTFCGSPLYASPEIVKGTPYHGPEVDCWSLGVLLYTLVYGAMPFDGSNFKRLVKQISQGDYFEPKKPSPASSLIRDMLNVNPACRADIEKICAHRWVNEAQSQSCVEIAEELANQTPVRLDLLLSLAPPPASADALLVNKEQDASAAPQAGPARSQSVGSLMELDHPRTFDAEKRRLSEAGRVPVAVLGKEAPPKRKLEQGPSTDEANQSGAKRKERSSRHRDRDHSSERSSGARHHRSSSRTKKTEPAAAPKKAGVGEVGRVPSLPGAGPELMDVDAEAVPPPGEAGTEAAAPEGRADGAATDTSPAEGEAAKTEAAAPSEEAKPGDEAKKVKVKRKKKTNSDLRLPDAKEEAATKTTEEGGPKGEGVGEVKEPCVKEEAKDEPVVKEAETSSAAAPTEAPLPKEAPPPTEALPPTEAPPPTEEAEGAAAKPPEPKEKKVARKIGSVKKKSDLSPSKIAGAADKPPEDPPAPPGKPVVRRRSKIFESEIQKFNALTEARAPEKPKKVFIPGVKVSDFKKAYERKSSVDLSGAVAAVSKAVGGGGEEGAAGEATPGAEEPAPPPAPAPAPESVTVATENTPEAAAAPGDGATATPAAPKDEAVAKKQKAVAIIGNAIAKPPKPTPDKLKLRGVAGVKSPPASPKKKSPPGDEEGGKVGATPTQSPSAEEGEGAARTPADAATAATPEPKKSSTVEIVLKSATLPRRKTSKAEIQLGAPRAEYRTEVEHMVGAAPPGSSRLRNQRSEVAFPVAAATAAQPHRSVSVEPEGAVKTKPKERIIPIQFERPPPPERPPVTSPPPARPPVPPLSQQRSVSQSQRSGSLSRQSTLDSDTESAGTVSGDPVKRSPREYIIPIAVEGGGYVTPRAGSLEPDAAAPEGGGNKPRSRPHHRFPRTMRMGSLLSDGGLSEDEGFNSISSPFSTLNRHREGEADEDGNKGFHHMHRLRSSRPSRRPTLDHADSVSSAEEEEDDDDGFELLTAESLFSTLLSRVRNLTQRLNVDDSRTGFPTSRFMNMNHNFPSHPSFWGNAEPSSRRVSETSRPSREESVPSWRRSVSRETDCDSQYSDATSSSLPRGSSRHDFDDLSDASTGPAYPSYYTPSLARRIARTSQELRNPSSPLPPHSALPCSPRRTGSLRSEDGLRRPHANWEFRTTSPLPAYHHRPAEPEGSESMQERIRRKSFFSRFNDTKKRPAASRRGSNLADET